MQATGWGVESRPELLHRNATQCTVEVPIQHPAEGRERVVHEAWKLVGIQVLQNHPTLPAIRKRLLEVMPQLHAHHAVKSLKVFGSFARQTQSEDSDLDLLVEFDTTPTLFALVRLEDELSEIAGVKVDLVIKIGLRPTVRERILQEAIPL